jgi:hypothetical protein
VFRIGIDAMVVRDRNEETEIQSQTMVELTVMTHNLEVITMVSSISSLTQTQSLKRESSHHPSVAEENHFPDVRTVCKDIRTVAFGQKLGTRLCQPPLRSTDKCPSTAQADVESMDPLQTGSGIGE